MGTRIFSSIVLAASTVGTSLYLVSCDPNVNKKDKFSTPSSNHEKEKVRIPLSEAIIQAEELCQRVKDESGSPGLVVSVSVNGENTFSLGLGYSDVENRVPCTRDTVMRIASISKSITMVGLARLLLESKVSLDLPIQEYLPAFPDKYWDGDKVQVTLRQLVSHLSGIRHYEKKLPNEKNLAGKPSNSNNEDKIYDNQRRNSQIEEFLIKDYYDNIEKSLELFQQDDLLSMPGETFLYTTHGWTLVSAVIEKVAEKQFPQFIKSIFHEMGLNNTYLDENKPLIYNRAKYYVRNKKGKLENAPYVDNSYKWAGGGFLSTVHDLTKFGNAILYSFQHSDGYLSQNITQMMLTPVANTSMPWDQDGQYGMGWGVVKSQTNFPHCNSRRFYASHTGGAVGASSVLLIMPRNSESNGSSDIGGVVVAIIVNLQNVGLNKTALDIANLFDQVEC